MATVFVGFTCVAQTLSRSQKIQLAISDARNFKLSDADLKKFSKDRAKHRPAFQNPFKHSSETTDMRRFQLQHDSIDYFAPWFMPSKTSTRDTTLLSDSTYVQYYRAAAYQNATSRHFLKPPMP